MSSEHEEGTEVMDVKFEVEGTSVRKPRRRRRGKGRKQRRESGGQHEEGENPAPDSDSDLPEHYPASSFAGCKLRPLDVPKAPENSTQFLIDDHNECRLYMSFETPNPYYPGLGHFEEDDDREIVEPEGEDAAFVDINYEYESPQDFDNSAYHDMEFELAYKTTRFDELLRLPKVDLIHGLETMETRLKDLSNELLKFDPTPVLHKLQHEFYELQEKNTELSKVNSQLRTLLLQSGRSDELRNFPPPVRQLSLSDATSTARDNGVPLMLSSEHNLPSGSCTVVRDSSSPARTSDTETVEHVQEMSPGARTEEENSIDVSSSTEDVSVAGVSSSTEDVSVAGVSSTEPDEEL